MLAKLRAQLRSLWFAVWARQSVEAQMRDEFQSHIAFRAEDLQQSGLAPDAAVRQARAEFGLVPRYREEARAARGLARLDGLRFSWIDFKLGFRMLARYPGLTVVGGLAMAFAIWIGAASFELTTQWLNPRLPLEQGDRVVGIQTSNTATQEMASTPPQDFAAWRGQIKSIVDVNAFRSFTSNMSADNRTGFPVEGAAVTASAFTMLRVPPLLGRTLVAADERPEAPLAIVISHDTWQSHFAGDSTAIGRQVRLGHVPYTLVGVMPKGFSFPMIQEVWTPLRLNVLDYPLDASPGVIVQGRLADGVSTKDAQHEMDFLAKRAAQDFPESHKGMTLRVLPFANAIMPVRDNDIEALQRIYLILKMLILLVCSNVALLIFARAASRESEIIVRSALGATRARIVMQLFAEALVLGGIGAIVGLAGAASGVRMGLDVVELNVSRLPFWFHASLSPLTLLYASGLVVLGALVAGVLPGLKVTRNLGHRLRQSTSGGGGLKFGGIWSVVIVLQVAVSVAFPAGVFLLQRTKAQLESFDGGFKSSEYLSARLQYSDESTNSPQVADELKRRLLADPGVQGVTFTGILPGMYHGLSRINAIEGITIPSDSLVNRGVNTASVGIDYLDVLGAGVVAGRDFTTADAATESRVVIVNQTFVERVLGGRNAVGRQIRLAPDRDSDASVESQPWYQIIGVTKDLGMNYMGETSGNGAAGLYYPRKADSDPPYLIVHTRGNPVAFTPRLQMLAYAVDPVLRLENVHPMNEFNPGATRIITTYFRIVLFISGIALLLSLAGIYAAVSFAVSRRTREIGIRLALGADARGVIVAVFKHPLAQVAIGVSLGAVLVTFVAKATIDSFAVRELALIAGYAVAMVMVSMLACLVPMRRALSVEPTEALRADA